MIGTRFARTKMLLVGLAAGAVLAGGAAAARPVIAIPVHARLAPVAGAGAAGRFSGVLIKPGEPLGAASPAAWRLTWKVSLPALGGAAELTLWVPARNGAARFVHVLCRNCRSSAVGRLALTKSQAGRIAQSLATVVVRAPSAILRGTVTAQANVPRPTG